MSTNSKIAMGNYSFMSNRTVQNSAGEEKGKLRVLVPTGSATADVDYTCPQCGFSEHTQQPWQRPFSLKCNKCGFLMRCSKLKDEIKREKKKAQASQE